MNPPGAEALLRIWEEQYAAHPIRRALALLEAGWPEAGAGGWARVPVGERDAGLLLLYERLFGGPLRTVTHCPGCGARLESEFSPAQVGARPPVLAAGPAWFTLRERDFEIEFRLPSSEDLLALPLTSDAAAGELLRRCIGKACVQGREVAAGQVPGPVAKCVIGAMAQHDPAADIQIGLHCPACSRQWELGFDIVSYFWDELEDWAQRVMAEVHALASAYGWSEREILALSPTRRKCYLEMVQA